MIQRGVWGVENGLEAHIPKTIIVDSFVEINAGSGQVQDIAIFGEVFSDIFLD
jgi:hypothetical protein